MTMMVSILKFHAGGVKGCNLRCCCRWTKWLCLIGCVLLAAYTSKHNSVKGQDFRILSEIYVQAEALPISQNLTLFSENLVFDFLLSHEVKPVPQEIVIYDVRQKLVVLLDPRRSIRTEISDLQLIKLIEVLSREVTQNETAQFLIKQPFEEELDLETGKLKLTSPAISYRVQGSQPKDPSLLPRYYEFLDTFSRLAATDPHKVPPFPRLKLNSAVKRLGWIPDQVSMSVKPNEFFKDPIEARSKHTLSVGLTNQDRELITDAKKNWLRYRVVDLPEYRGLTTNSTTVVTNLPGDRSTIQSRIK